MARSTVVQLRQMQRARRKTVSTEAPSPQRRGAAGLQKHNGTISATNAETTLATSLTFAAWKLDAPVRSSDDGLQKDQVHGIRAGMPPLATSRRADGGSTPGALMYRHVTDC
jgi:hypothetical protein